MDNKNNKTMEMPMVIQIEQLKYNISKVIKDSNLPIFIINPILKDFYQEFNTILQEYTKQEFDKYNQMNSENNNKNSQLESEVLENE